MFGLGLKLKLIGGALIALMLWAAWSHYTFIRDDRLSLIKEVARVEQAFKSEKASFEAYQKASKKNYAIIQKDITDLDVSYKASKKKADKFSKMLERHNFGHLTFKKPGLIERKANRATDKIFKKFEELGEK